MCTYMFLCLLIYLYEAWHGASRPPLKLEVEFATGKVLRAQCRQVETQIAQSGWKGVYL